VPNACNLFASFSARRPTPDDVGILRAPPSAPAEGLIVNPSPPRLQAARKKSKFSFHLSKMELNVKDKNESRPFFSAEHPSRFCCRVPERFERAVGLIFIDAHYTPFVRECKRKLNLSKKIFTTTGE
jgi:hypothetical protein